MSAEAINNSTTAVRKPISVLSAASWGLEQLPVVVLGISVLFLQGYALQFWNELLGSSGWGISVGLEVLHIWFWYRAAMAGGLSRFAWMILAMLATAMLLGGALHEVTRPLLQESARIEVSQQTRRSLENEARLLTENLAAYRRMAADQGRRGWQDDIRRDTARLQVITERQRNLTAHSSNAARQPWMNRVTQGGVIGVAVLFQIAAVLAIWSLSGGGRNSNRLIPPVAESKQRNKNVAATMTAQSQTLRQRSEQPQRDLYRQLWTCVEGYARSNSARLARANGTIAQASLARDLGITPPDFTGIKLLAQGKQVSRIPAREAVESLAARFEIAMPS